MMKQTAIATALLLAAVSAFAAAPAKQKPVRLALPVLTKAQASAALRTQVKGAKILESELEKEAGQLIWSFDVESKSGITEVWLNPHTGAVIKKQAESAAREKREMMGEKRERRAAAKNERREEARESAARKKSATAPSPMQLPASALPASSSQAKPGH
ncbi:MAG TPA: PepSY domain-containing protein [Elusimicrobiota bacterium]|nr:PepSY domain-containing protein [Elusimicrobiota bacterium]